VTRFLERIFPLFPIRKIKRGTEKQHPFGGYLPADQQLGNRLISEIFSQNLRREKKKLPKAYKWKTYVGKTSLISN